MSDLLDDLSPFRRRALEKMRDEAMASSEREEFEHGPAIDWNTPSPDPEGDENAAHEAGLTHGAQLDGLARFIRRYVAMSSEQAETVALWVAHTHAFSAFDVTPYLQISSAEPRSGKTRLLELLGYLVFRPWRRDCSFGGNAVSHNRGRPAGPASRRIRHDLRSAQEEQGGPSSCAQRRQPSRHERATVAGKCAPRLHAAVESYGRNRRSPRDSRGPRDQHSAQASRSQRTGGGFPAPRRRGRGVPSLPPSLYLVQFHTDDLRDARPDIPPELDDRAADAWEPLLAMADLTGRDWPQRARNAALQLSGIRAERNVSDGIRVLADIRDVLDELGASRISSKELTQRLCAIPEAPWADYKGTGLDQRALAKLLGQYEIKTKDRRVRTVAQDLRACAVRRRRAAIPSPQQH